jgi:hypothetical protein
VQKPAVSTHETTRLDASAVSEQLARLQTLDGGALWEEWRRLYRAEPPPISRDLRVRALAYRIQELACGGLSRAVLRRLGAAINSPSPAAAGPPRPLVKPGARLVREWHGRTHVVVVADDGFDFGGKRYRSLTQIAREITGARWSGPRFFGLTGRSAKAVTKTHAAELAGAAAEKIEDLRARRDHGDVSSAAVGQNELRPRESSTPRGGAGA